MSDAHKHDHDHHSHEHEHRHSHGHDLDHHEHELNHEHGHSHEHTHRHSHDHDHDGHEHHADDHAHEHGGGHEHEHGAAAGSAVPEALKKTVALLDYMLGHNRDHAGELADMAKKLRDADLGGAAALVEEGVKQFEKGNGALEAALKKIRG